METRNHQEHIEHAFDTLCKKVLKQHAIDIHRETTRRSKREVNFSEMSARELAELAVMDEYFKDEYIFEVLGETVGVTDCNLAVALKNLPADRRDIVLMKYFFDMTDEEIAGRLNKARRTVAHQRTSTLKTLKKNYGKRGMSHERNKNPIRRKTLDTVSCYRIGGKRRRGSD